MGVGDFCPLLRESNSAPDKLEEVSGQTIGVDISGHLHTAVRSGNGRDEYHALPRVPVNAVVAHLRKLVDACLALSIKLICVFDGCRHPSKKLIDDKRKKDAEEAAEKLAAFYKKNDASDYKSAQQQRGKCASVRADVIAIAVQFLRENDVECVCAPFEADFQLVYMEQKGLIDGILSEDGDLYVFGAKTLLMNLDLSYVNDDTKMNEPMCAIVRRATIMTQQPFSGWSDDDVIVFALFLGCDYLPRIVGHGLEQCKDLMVEWRGSSTASQRNAILDRMNGKSWPLWVGGKVAEFRRRFEEAKAVFEHAPVLAVPASSSSSSSRGARSTGFKLVPLKSLPRSKDWEGLIGWDPATTYSSFCPSLSYKDAYSLTRSPRFPDKELPGHLPEKPQHPYDAGKTAGFGAVVDFDEYPINIAPNTILLTWLWWRRVPMVKSTGRAALIAQVKKVLKQEEEGRPLSMRNDEETHGAHHYAVWEPEFIGIGGTAIEWLADVVGKMRSLPAVTHAYLSSTFPGRPGVHSRAFLRYISGHYNIKSWRVCTACMPSAPDEHLTLFEFKVTPSMKAEVYSVVLVFSAGGAFNLQLSHCGCPDGCFACSRIIGAFLVVMTVQVRPGWSIDDVIAFMPEPIKSIQSRPIAIDYVYNEVEADEKRAAKKLKSKMNEVAKEHPGYSKPDGGGGDDDDDEEGEAAAAAAEDSPLPDICADALEEIQRAELKADERGDVPAAKYKADKIDEHNEALVKKLENESEERKHKRDKRLQRILLLQERDDGISSDNALFLNLSHEEFRKPREARLAARGVTWAGGSPAARAEWEEMAKF